MTVKVQKKEINGFKYITTLFPAMQGYLLGRKMMGLISTKDAMGVDIDKLCELDPDGSLLLEILSYTTRDDRVINSVSFNEFFTGNYQEMISVIGFVLEANFADFFQEKGIGKEKESAIPTAKLKHQSDNA